MSIMQASVCRYRLTRNSLWENGIVVRVATPDIRNVAAEHGLIYDDETVTIIGSGGDVYYPKDLSNFDEIWCGDLM